MLIKQKNNEKGQNITKINGLLLFKSNIANLRALFPLAEKKEKRGVLFSS